AQALARLAVGGGVDREARQVAQVPDGGVAVDHLQHEQVHRLDRPEHALPPAVARAAAGLADRLVRHERPHVLLDPRQRAGDTGHPVASCWLVTSSTTILTGGYVLRKFSKSSRGADLRLK